MPKSYHTRPLKRLIARSAFAATGLLALQPVAFAAAEWERLTVWELCGTVTVCGAEITLTPDQPYVYEARYQFDVVAPFSFTLLGNTIRVTALEDNDYAGYWKRDGYPFIYGLGVFDPRQPLYKDDKYGNSNYNSVAVIDDLRFPAVAGGTYDVALPPPSAVPEPGTYSLMACGLLALAALAKRSRARPRDNGRTGLPQATLA